MGHTDVSISARLGRTGGGLPSTFLLPRAGGRRVDRQAQGDDEACPGRRAAGGPPAGRRHRAGTAEEGGARRRPRLPVSVPLGQRWTAAQPGRFPVLCPVTGSPSSSPAVSPRSSNLHSSDGHTVTDQRLIPFVTEGSLADSLEGSSGERSLPGIQHSS